MQATRRNPIETATAVVRALASERMGIVAWSATSDGADARGSGIVLYRADGAAFLYSREAIEQRRRQEVDGYGWENGAENMGHSQRAP